MKRVVLLGVLGLSACSEPPVEKPPVNEQVCPLVSSERASPPTEALASSASSLRRVTGPDEDGREPVLVRFRRGGVQATARRTDRVARVGGKVKYHWPALGTLAARLTPQEREALARDSDVLSIEPDRPVRALGLPRLPRLPLAALLAAPNSNGDVGEYTPGVKLVQAPAVWDANLDGTLDPGAPTGEGIKVCVIDSGIDDRHPELQISYRPGQGLGKDFVDNDDDPKDQDKDGTWGGGHGTHVAATIAAQLGVGGKVDPMDATMSPKGVVGVAPGVTLLVARVLDTRGNGSTSDVIEALKWCQDQKAHIASLSLGSTDSNQVEKDAFDAAFNAGMLSFAASGNGGSEDPSAVQPTIYPAGYDSVIAVGAVDENSEHPAFSQTGEHLSLVAPGVDVLSAYIVGAATFSEVNADGTLRASRGLEYSNVGEYTGKLVDCGLADSLSSCRDGVTCDGFVALVQRGTITFAEKVKHVQAQGARAVIIVNNDPAEGEGNFTLGRSDTWPPVASVSNATGDALEALLGSDVKVSIQGADYASLTGTSMATPHASAVAALLWSARPDLSHAQVRQVLQNSAKDLGDPGRDKVHGHGLVQAKAALDRAATDYPRSGVATTP